MFAFEEVCQQDSVPVTDPPERDLAFLKQFHEIGPRNVQQVCDLLDRQLGVNRRDRDGVAVGDLGQDVDEQAERMPGDLHRGVGITRHERDRRAAHRGALTEKPVQDINSVGRLACCGLIGNRELMFQDSRGSYLFASSDICIAEMILDICRNQGISIHRRWEQP